MRPYQPGEASPIPPYGEQPAEVQLLDPGERVDLDDRSDHFRSLSCGNGGAAGQRVPDDHRGAAEVPDDAEEVTRNVRATGGGLAGHRRPVEAGLAVPPQVRVHHPDSRVGQERHEVAIVVPPGTHAV